VYKVSPSKSGSERIADELLGSCIRINVASEVDMRLSRFNPRVTRQTLALLRILALGNQQIKQGDVVPVSDAMKRLRSKRPRSDT
jgi:hypothetical protein